jgi:hypothetical protein
MVGDRDMGSDWGNCDSDLGAYPWSFAKYDVGKWAGGSDDGNQLISGVCLVVMSDMGNGDLGCDRDIFKPCQAKEYPLNEMDGLHL